MIYTAVEYPAGRDAHDRPTIGVVANRQIYLDTTIGRYEQMLFSGICAAAGDHGCNLLLACGVGPDTAPYSALPAWPIPLPNTNFVPVGPWNTSGLIAIPPFSDVQLRSLAELDTWGHPCVFTYPQEGHPSVGPANHEGIAQAFAHLIAHGHWRIAFIADSKDGGGDGGERLAAYRSALAAHDLPFDAALVGYGGHDAYASCEALRQMIEAGVEFSAVLASNDESAIGAMRALSAAGCRVPQDVAVIGFDDVLYAKAQQPPLTTVHHPTFELGYQAVELLLDYLDGRRSEPATVRVPTRLIVRESCGCLPASSPGMQAKRAIAVGGIVVETELDLLVRAMSDAVAAEVGRKEAARVESWCRKLVTASITTLDGGDPQAFSVALDKLLDWIEAADGNAYPWHTAISILHRHLDVQRAAQEPLLRATTAEDLIDRAHLRISERILRQHTRQQVRQAELLARMGAVTTRLLTALELRDILAIMAEHLPRVGIRHAAIGLYEAEDDDPVAWTNLYLPTPIGPPTRLHFRSREFPPTGLYDDFTPYTLALLPLIVEDGPAGFVSFDSAHLEQCALIVRHLAAALRNSQLHSAAAEGRRLAEEANRIKSRFLSTVSHELRTPLGIILGLSEMVLGESTSEGAGLSNNVVQDVGRIYENAQHLGRLISDVLDLASSEAGQMRIYLEPLDLAETLAGVIRTAAQMAEEKGLEWQARLPESGAWIQGDSTRLRQVALNLITNAIKFTARGSISLDMAVAGDNVTVWVSDTGPGVPLADQQRIFDEFRSSERTADRGYGGLGLGLAICKQLIERHNGTIGVSSSGVEDGGATFFFTLPLIGTKEPGSSASGEDTANRRLVILSANSDSSAALVTALHGRGFAVQVEQIDAAGGWLAPLVARPPAAVILEEPLASQRGWEILAVLKRHPASEHIPVLMYALDPADNRGALLELDYMLKPVAPEQLAYVLDQQLNTDDATPTVRTILVVDDDPDMRALHTRLVRKQLPQSNILQASNGREALAMMEHELPSLVLLDLMMPELDGFGVLEAMRAQEATRDVPVVVLTGQVLTEEDIRRLNNGVAVILSKTLFSADEIMEHIEATLRHQRKLGNSMQLVVRRAIVFIHSHYNEVVTRERIAAHLNINADHLTASFGQEMGVTPISYLNRYRISRARQPLEQTNRSITEIALSVGFTDGASFSRAFHREVGMTPNAYRREKQKLA